MLRTVNCISLVIYLLVIFLFIKFTQWRTDFLFMISRRDGEKGD